MSWEVGFQPRRPKRNLLAEIEAEKGILSDERARVLLGGFFRQNLGITWQLLSKQKLLLPIQELILNAWFEKDYSLVVAGRGVGKSYMIAVFVCLYCLFNENARIVLVANNFRRVKDIFGQVERFLNEKGAHLLRENFELKSISTVKMGKQNDQYLLNCRNGSYVKGLPLGVGENLRGERANVLIIDEGLLISEHVQTTILEPFLTARSDAGLRMEVVQKENELIEAGLLLPSERLVFPNNKLIITSSASYQFEYLYEGLFNPYIKKIMKENQDTSIKDPSYFVSRISYEAIPPDTILDESVFKAAKERGADNPNFRREYCAHFVDSSDGYFNVKRLHECTVPDGEQPTVQVMGNKRAEYILAIDPAYGESKSNDFFAMGVYMIQPETRQIIQVHSYGRAGGDIKDNFNYLVYLLTYFNIVWVAIDDSGTEFIQGFNESVIARQHNLSLGFINCDFDADDQNYTQQILEAKYQWNVTSRKFVYGQRFSSQTIRRMNEYLHDGIAGKKVWFGSRMEQHQAIYDSVISNFKLPFAFKNVEDEDYLLSDFISDQDDWIAQTKRQLALIEVKSTGLGTLQYNIPSHLRKSTSATRARRDNYTCLLMAYYASKHYFDMMSTEDNIQPMGFTPIFF